MAYERPLYRMEHGQYVRIPNKVQAGYPTTYTINKTTDGIALTLWPVPMYSTQINYTMSRIPDDVTDGAQTIDIPQEWMEAVYLGLAARLSSTYGTMRTDPATTQAVFARAADLKQRLLDNDRAPSIFMGSENDSYF